MGFTIKSNAPTPVAVGAPCPLKVTVSAQPAEYSFQGYDLLVAIDKPQYADQFSKAKDAGGPFVQALKDSHGFASVESTVRSGVLKDNSSSDLTIEALFKGRYITDPAVTAKAAITGLLFLLPMPFISYKDAVVLTGDMFVYDRNGRLIAKYNEEQNAEITARAFSCGKANTATASMEAVASDLATKLVNNLVNDRAALEEASKRTEQPEP